MRERDRERRERERERERENEREREREERERERASPWLCSRKLQLCLEKNSVIFFLISLGRLFQ